MCECKCCLAKNCVSEPGDYMSWCACDCPNCVTSYGLRNWEAGFKAGVKNEPRAVRDMQNVGVEPR